MTDNIFKPMLTEIEIALRKEESPSDTVQWAIERLNRFQEHYEEVLNLCIIAERISEREKVLDKIRFFIVKHETDGSCPFNSMNEGNCHNYERCDLCVFDHAREEFRKQGMVSMIARA